MNEELLFLHSFVHEHHEEKKEESGEPAPAPVEQGNLDVTDAAKVTPPAKPKFSLPKAQGIGLMLILIFLIIFAIQPVKDRHYSRLTLLWMVLTKGGSLMNETGTAVQGTVPSNGSTGKDENHIYLPPNVMMSGGSRS